MSAMHLNTAELKAPTAVDGYQRTSLIVGVLGLLGCGAGYVLYPGDHHATFYQAWLIGFSMWVGVSGGMLSLLMIGHLTGGHWWIAARRITEAASKNFYWLWIPGLLVLLGGMHPLYEWAHTGWAAEGHVNAHKAQYLNTMWFSVRYAIYFVCWIFLAWRLSALSARQDADPDYATRDAMKTVSAPGLIIYAMTISFASFDWVMSLDPHWFSTIYGLIIVAGQLMSAMAIIVAVNAHLVGYKPMSELVTSRHFHAWGKYLLTFVMLWAYLSFSQLIIIWSGNLPEEITWYQDRWHNGWQYVSMFLLVLQFMGPFLILLQRDLKKRPRTLASIAIFLLLMRVVEWMWLVHPNFHGSVALDPAYWVDFAAVLGIGGVWLFFFFNRLKKMPLLPVGDPALEDYLEKAHASGH
jgi:hypothetical protein